MCFIGQTSPSYQVWHQRSTALHEAAQRAFIVPKLRRTLSSNQNLLDRTCNLDMSSFVSRIRRSITLADLVTPLKDDLFPSQKDNVFSFQLASPDFVRLTADTLLICEICGDKHNAKFAIEASHKLGIIDPATGGPCTSKIDRSMLAAMPTISARKQRQIVCLLFFWEEEIVRWQLLVEQEEEIKERIGTTYMSDRDSLEAAHVLEALDAKKRSLPSARDESGRLLREEQEEEALP
jgi:hypothetical protein